jgi:hypothetical protein
MFLSVSNCVGRSSVYCSRRCRLPARPCTILRGSAKGAAWLHRKEDAFPTLTMRDEIAVVRHIDKGILYLTGAIGTCLISI